MRNPSEWPVVGWFDSVGKIIGGITALVVLIGAIVTLVHQLSPGPPPPRKAALKVERVSKTSLEYYLRDSGQPEQVAEYDRDELAQLGNYYYVRVTVEGLRGRQSEIVWSLDRLDRGTPIERLQDASRWIHQLLQTVKPPANAYEFVAKVWIQHPQFPGKFYAILEIDYPKNHTLGFAETPPFRVEEPQPVTETRFVTTTAATTIPATTVAVTTVITAPTATETTTTSTRPTTTSVVTTTTTQTIPGTTTTRVVTYPLISTVPPPAKHPQPTPRPKATLVAP